MNPRFTKEIRLLAFPAGITILCAAARLTEPFADSLAPGDMVRNMLTLLVQVCFIGSFFGAALLAAISFGAEFQFRTMSLLLSQAADRFRLWRDKMLVLAVALIIVGSVQCLTATQAILSREEAWLTPFFVSGFLVILVCSTPFWTLIAGSTIGGMAFSLSAMFVVGAGANAVLERILVRETPAAEEQVALGMALTALLYSATCLRLGWRKFANLELRDALASTGPSLPRAFPGAQSLANLMRCRPAGSLRNLVRKELRLQKPVFLIAGIFTVCWLLTFAMLILFPARREFCETIFNVLTAFYIPLTALLVGCVALGEEKALGLTAWHLTLPVSARRQWLVKLAVAALTAFMLDLVLPLLLTGLTLIKTKVGLVFMFERPNESWSLAIPLVVVFVLSFWSGSMVANTVRAALTTVLAGTALFLTVMIASWCAAQLGGLQTGYITSLIARFQWSPYSLRGYGAALLQFVLAVVFVGMVIVLGQSFQQFRRGLPQSATILRNAAWLTAYVLAVSFWSSDWAVSLQQQYRSPLVMEVTAALRTIHLDNAELRTLHPRRLTSQDLEKTGLLSQRTRRWLRNASIDVGRVNSNSRHFAGQWVYSATINLPNGVSVPCSWSVPQPSPSPEQKP